MNEINLILNSRSPGVTYDNTSFFSVPLSEGLPIPNAAKACYCSLISASIWNNFPNISQALTNNHLYWSDGINQHDITINDGLYSVVEIGDTLKRSLIEYGKVGTEIVFIPEYASGFLFIGLNTGYTLDFTLPDTCRILLGYNSQILTGPVGGVTRPIKADNEARFSDVSSIQIHSTISKSMVNGRMSDVLASFPLTSKSGYLSYFQAIHPINTDGSHLINSATTLNRIDFYLTDQNGNRLTTNLTWSVVVKIQWK